MLLAQEYAPDLSQLGKKFAKTPLGLLAQGDASGAMNTLGQDAALRVNAMSNPETALQTGFDFMGGGLLGTLRQTGQKLAGYSDDAAELFKQQYKIPKEQQLQSKELPTEFNQAFDSYMDGRITQPEYIDAMNKFYPASVINKVPELTPQDHLVYGLGKKAKEGENIIGIGSTFDDGDRVLSRLDIPAYNNYNVWSASIKQDGGETVYGQVAHLTSKDGPITFKVNPNDALKIAKGKSRGGTNKFPMATIDGNWKNTKPEDVKALAEKYLNDPNWSQVGMNPKRAGYFYDKADMMPVSEADEVLQIGPLVLAKNAKKFDPSQSVTTEVNPVTGSLLSF